MTGPAQRTVRALTLGAWVRQARELAGLRQEELAARAGLSQPTVSRTERGVRVLDAYELGQVAQVLNSTPGGVLAALERAEASMHGAACALCEVPEGAASWEELVPAVGVDSVRALARAAAVVVLLGAGTLKLAERQRKTEAST